MTLFWLLWVLALAGRLVRPQATRLVRILHPARAPRPALAAGPAAWRLLHTPPPGRCLGLAPPGLDSRAGPPGLRPVCRVRSRDQD
jgi:hypothetical protein